MSTIGLSLVRRIEGATTLIDGTIGCLIIGRCGAGGLVTTIRLSFLIFLMRLMALFLSGMEVVLKGGFDRGF